MRAETVATTVDGVRRYRRTKENAAWRGMLERCYNKKNDSYPNYGGRGIQVCRRWRESYLTFLWEVGRAPPDGTLERIDPNGHYEPGNVRWATVLEQQRNRTNTPFVTYEGKRIPLSEAAERAGLKYITVYQRMARGLPEERWLEKVRPRSKGNEPKPRKRQVRPSSIMVTYEGRRMTLLQAADLADVNPVTVRMRRRAGWPEDRWFEKEDRTRLKGIPKKDWPTLRTREEGATRC